MQAPKIAVFPPEILASQKWLLQSLAQIFAVDFIAGDGTPGADVAAALLFGNSRERAPQIAGSGMRCLAFVGTQPVASVSPVAITLASTSYLPKCFRGRQLPHRELKYARDLTPEPGDNVIAQVGNEILWLHRSLGGASLDLVAVEPPQLQENEHLFRYFERQSWMQLLPLLFFLKHVSRWEYPALRACFMFDDPNLHWHTYGYANYRELARDAHAHNYHASFATVPVDAWYVNREAAAIFRDNPGRLSFLIHGNNHTRFELAQQRTEQQRLALAAQAIHRIERFERAAGLVVPRVMAAPHGACNPDMATALVRAGFDGACISRSSIMARNPGLVWPATIGLNPAEFLGSGLPTIPRFNIQWDETYILFAAFLGQPIIPVGHEDDLAEGLDLLRRLSALINSVGEVHWTDLGSIMESNFCTSREGGVLNLKMFSRRIRLVVPVGINHLCVHRPWLTGDNDEAIVLRRPRTPEGAGSRPSSEMIPVVPGDEISIASVCPGPLKTGEIAFSRTPLWAVARRVMCETRDRLRPFTDGIKKRSRS